MSDLSKSDHEKVVKFCEDRGFEYKTIRYPSAEASGQEKSAYFYGPSGGDYTGFYVVVVDSIDGETGMPRREVTVTFDWIARCGIGKTLEIVGADNGYIIKDDSGGLFVQNNLRECTETLESLFTQRFYARAIMTAEELLELYLFVGQKLESKEGAKLVSMMNAEHQLALEAPDAE